MTVPPEVLFHRYFQTLGPVSRRQFRGKVDLDRMENEAEASLLAGLHKMFNDALAVERADDTARAPHDRFHFDYVDSDIDNALAFHHAGYSFIGLTIPFVRRSFDTCRRLSVSDAVVGALGLEATPAVKDGLFVVLLRTQLNHVVSHEYTHHVHGHVQRESPDSTCLEEYREDGVGDLTRQTQELDADGYAVYLVLSNLLLSDERQLAINSLGIAAASPTVQEQHLLATFVLALGAHYLDRHPRPIDSNSIYQIIHPPPAARMHFVMQHQRIWSGQNRPHLQDWMMPNRFQVLMAAAAEALRGMKGRTAWSDQVAFLRSEAGARYVGALTQRVDAYKATL